jgi:EthD domain
MMKFMLAARRKPQDTQERYFYEWGIIHVALMVTTPSVMRSFKRYAQHYSVQGVLSDSLIYPLSPMAWDNMADHWVEDIESLVLPFKSADYCERMQPHSFGDSNFALELTSMRPIYEAPGFQSGGIKLIHFLKRRPEISQDEFVKRWQTEYAPVLVRELQRLGVLRKYQQNPQLSLNPEIFKGTLFERGGVGLYGGIEEIWLNSLHDLAVLRGDAHAYLEIRSAASKIVADEGTFSMVTTERVIYDYSVPGKESPVPAVLRSGTLESLIDAHGYKSWNVPDS